MGRTKIAWATRTVNVVSGCSKPAAIPAAGLVILKEKAAREGVDVDIDPVRSRWLNAGSSPECARCYAEALSTRRGWTLKPWSEQNALENIRLRPDRFGELGIKAKPVTNPPSERERFFLCSMGDLFHESVPDEFLSQLWPHLVKNEHIHMLLTKRIDRAAAWPGPWPDHIWLGTTIGHTSTKWRAEYLRRSRAKVRFISAEPLLESIVPLNLEGIHQVIVGGESGPGYRKLEREWVLEIREACEKAGVAFFFKQDAGARPGLRPYLEIDGEKLVFHQFPGELTPPTIWTPEVEVV